jgi:hypothetical protein
VRRLVSGAWDLGDGGEGSDLASVRLGDGMGVAVPAADGFVVLAVFRRLQQLVARYPRFRAEPESTEVGTILDEQK